MNTRLLENHICETIKEWQLKIGYAKGSIKLYYPSQSLADMLDLKGGYAIEDLNQLLRQFVNVVNIKFGDISISNVGDRFCLDIPSKGCRYVKENIPDPLFLKDLLNVITTKGCSIEEVRKLFIKYASDYVELDKTKQGLGHVFYFNDNKVDEHVYCIESDDFGITYHRFSKMDYLKME